MSLILVAVVALAAIVGLLVLTDRQNRRHAGQVADLCQRIQAPDTAVATHVLSSEDFTPAHLPFNDDEAWREHEDHVRALMTEVDGTHG